MVDRTFLLVAGGSADECKEIETKRPDQPQNPLNILFPPLPSRGLQKHITREEEVALGFFEPDGVTPKLDYKTIGEGASTTIYAALHKPLDAYGGAYLDDCSIAETIPPERANKEDAAKLWEMTIGWIKSKGFGGWDEEFFML